MIKYMLKFNPFERLNLKNALVLECMKVPHQQFLQNLKEHPEEHQAIDSQMKSVITKS